MQILNNTILWQTFFFRHQTTTPVECHEWLIYWILMTSLVCLPGSDWFPIMMFMLCSIPRIHCISRIFLKHIHLCDAMRHSTLQRHKYNNARNNQIFSKWKQAISSECYVEHTCLWFFIITVKLSWFTVNTSCTFTCFQYDKHRYQIQNDEKMKQFRLTFTLVST